MAQSTTIFDRILSLIPGYAGYADRQAQRKSDTRLRTRIAGALLRCETAVQSRLGRELSGINKDLMMELEHCRRLLNTLADRVRYAPLGTSGITSEKRLSETDLNRILQHDLQLMEVVSELNERIDDLATKDIITVVDRINRMFEERNEFIREFN